MKTKPPPQRRKFPNDWDQVEYLYDHLLYWLFERENTAKARAYAQRLKPLLRKLTAEHQAIFGEECWSLVYEAMGDLPKAITHRQNEIHLIRRLHDAARDSPHEDVVLKDYGCQDLSDRLDLLATLYHDRGALDEAIAVLQESKQLCHRYRLKFDAQDLLADYLAEAEERKNPADASNGREVYGKSRRA